MKKPKFIRGPAETCEMGKVPLEMAERKLQTYLQNMQIPQHL